MKRSTLAIRSYVDDIYFAETGADKRVRSSTRRVIRYLSRFLGREATLADFTDQNLCDFIESLEAPDISRKPGAPRKNAPAKEKFSKWTRKLFRDQLRAVWKHAVAGGHLVRLPRHYTKNAPNRTADDEPLASSPQSLLRMFRDHYEPMRLLGRSPRSSKQYVIMLRHFARFLGRPAVISDLDDLTVSRFAAYLRNNCGQSPISVNKGLDKILSLWRFLNRRRIVETYPEIRKLPEPGRIPQAWTLEQAAKLLATCRRVKGTFRPNIRAADWWVALHLLIWDTGERVGALLGLCWDDVDLDTGWLCIRAELRKGKVKPLMRRLRPETLDALRAIIKPQRSLILPWDLKRCLLYTHYTKVLAAAGLPNDRRSKFHRMRRTVASHFAAAGGDATALLDHTSRSVTLHYLDPRIVKEVQAIDLLPAIGKGGVA